MWHVFATLLVQNLLDNIAGAVPFFDILVACSRARVLSGNSRNPSCTTPPSLVRPPLFTASHRLFPLWRGSRCSRDSCRLLVPPMSVSRELDGKRWGEEERARYH